MQTALKTSAPHIKSLPLLHQGKVRDIYELDDKHLLIVTSDRISAFDVVMDDAIPGKGCILNRLSNFWFAYLSQTIPNHSSDISPTCVVEITDNAELAARSVIVKKSKPLPIEAIVRGYLIGSGWSNYQNDGTICNIQLPNGLKIADKLPQTIFTPSTKATEGKHDVNIGFERVSGMLGLELAEEVRDKSLLIYRKCAEYALSRGIIIADTKFEFGLDDEGKLLLIDEVLTPDSSRFWDVESYRPGSNPPSFDKQFLRDYLETLYWDKTPPPPRLPIDVINATAEKYREIQMRLMSENSAG